MALEIEDGYELYQVFLYFDILQVVGYKLEVDSCLVEDHIHNVVLEDN